jgi:small basic protein (TIGR04137 family)
MNGINRMMRLIPSLLFILSKNLERLLRAFVPSCEIFQVLRVRVHDVSASGCKFVADFLKSSLVLLEHPGSFPMSLDKSLRSKSRLSRSRNVLKREERILQLKAQDRFDDGQSPLGLPKTRVVKTVVGKKKKKKAKEEEGEAAAK